MDISVLVCTKNRCERLPAFIEGLKALDLSSVEAELILIDNSSSDDTAAMLAKLADASPFARTSVLSAAGPLSAAKNTALQHAEGDITIFTNHDCFPDPDWLLQMKRSFHEHSEAHAAGGHVRLYDLEDYPMTITFWIDGVPQRALAGLRRLIGRVELRAELLAELLLCRGGVSARRRLHGRDRALHTLGGLIGSVIGGMLVPAAALKARLARLMPPVRRSTGRPSVPAMAALPPAAMFAA